MEMEMEGPFGALCSASRLHQAAPVLYYGLTLSLPITHNALAV